MEMPILNVLPEETPAGAGRWAFLEKEADAACVVTCGMQVLFLNELARTLVPRRWFGCRCWEVFPVGEASCASRCPTVKAVRGGSEVTYCEETLKGRDGTPLQFASPRSRSIHRASERSFSCAPRARSAMPARCDGTSSIAPRASAHRSRLGSRA